MASVNAVWGIDVGQCALKALRLQQTQDGSVEVTHFDLIEHPKILSQPDAETEQLIQNALEKFLSRNELGKARIAVAVPGQSSFARFVKLPPVEPKRIPEIVKFEAVQQIPFDIEEVEWDYQTFMSPTSPEVEVGIFAMRKELVLKHLSYLRAAGIEPDVVQLAPLALYNMMTYDGLVAKQGATILIDVGAENTDLVISDGDRIWLRSIPLGGNSFTEALVKAFKLPFSKAENLKRTAATSKYARQIFVAMRPVFSDLVSEVQRSIGFYTSLHRDAQITRVLCLGNAFRLPGLEKYLGQNLQVETVRPNAFNRLKPSPMVNAPAFVENLWSFGVAYGLGAQALATAPISSNLLPFSIARQRHWHAERPWFAAAAAAMILGLGVTSWAAINKKNHAEGQVLPPSGAQSSTSPTLNKYRDILQKKRELLNRRGKEQEEIQDIERLVRYRPIIPQVAYLVHNAVPNDWRAKSIKLVAERNGGKPVDFRKDVWPVIGTMEFAGPVDPAGKTGLLATEFRSADPVLSSSAYIYLLDRVSMELFHGKPPEISHSGSGPAGHTPPAAEGNPFAAQASPPKKGRDTAVSQATQNGPDKYLRITLNGYTNSPQDRHAVELQRRLLDQINGLFRADETGRLVATDEMLGNLVLTNLLSVDKVARFVNVENQPPACWPQIKASKEPADGAAGGAMAPAAAAAAGQQPVLEYPIVNFTVDIDVQVMPEPPKSQPAGQTGGGN